jgi:hypothetical protein
MRKILHKPYRLTVKVATKITKLDQTLAEHQSLKTEVNDLRADLKSYKDDYNYGWPKGHFYSPIHNLDDLKPYKKVQAKSKEKFAKTIPGFSDQKIVKELDSIKAYFKEFDYPMHDDGSSRFYTQNVSYPTLDAAVLYSMLRKHQPKRVIEIGSGFTSGLMMGVNEQYFDNKMSLTFIEPYPDLLYRRMRKGDKTRYNVIPNGVQDVTLSTFKQLKKDDILFIDSTHVSKFNSDVNYEIFDILPELNKGVIIHFHDVFDGFEYPLKWLKDGWAWNEDYMLRAFLMNNSEYEILLMNDYLAHRHPQVLKNAYPKQDKNILNGGSLWLRKV